MRLICSEDDSVFSFRNICDLVTRPWSAVNLRRARRVGVGVSLCLEARPAKSSTNKIEQ